MSQVAAIQSQGLVSQAAVGKSLLGQATLVQGSVSKIPVKQRTVSEDLVPIRQVIRNDQNLVREGFVSQIPIKNGTIIQVKASKPAIKQESVAQAVSIRSDASSCFAGQEKLKDPSAITLLLTPIGPHTEAAFRLIDQARKVSEEFDKKYEAKYGRSPYEGELANLKPDYSCFGLGSSDNVKVPVQTEDDVLSSRQILLRYLEDVKKIDAVQRVPTLEERTPYMPVKDDLVMQPGPMLEDETFDESVNVDLLDDDIVFPKRKYPNMYCLLTGRKHIDDEVKNERINVDALSDDFLD